VPIIVARTNFATMKGQLIRVISFPKERENIFERQSAKFLIFLFLLSCASYGILLSKLVHYADAQTLVVKFLDLITITVPPGLPVSMTFGIIFALEKLKNKKIFCSSPNKVIHGGLTNWLCFDKTGTLTEDFMDFNCLVLYDGNKFADPIINQQIAKVEGVETMKGAGNIDKIIEKNKGIHLALNNMAMNHTIVNVEQTG
jgi:cation-transporting ATPase 13A2